MSYKGMRNKDSGKDCLGLRRRICGLHQTWKWLHQTIELHEYLTSMTSADTSKCLMGNTMKMC